MEDLKQTLSRLIDAIYGSSLEPASWPRTLADVMQSLGFANISIDLYDGAKCEVVLQHMVGMDHDALQRIPGYGRAMMDQWGGVERVNRMPLDVPLLLSGVNPRGLTEDSRFYAEYDQPQGILDVMTLSVQTRGRSRISVTLGRHKADGPIDQLATHQAALLAPHFKRAFWISQLLDMQAVRSNNLETVLNKLSIAVLLVDGNGHLVYANRASEQILAAGYPLRCQHGKLVAPPSLEAMMRDAVANGRGGQAVLQGEDCDGTQAQRMAVHAAPLSGARDFEQNALCALFISCGDWGLTPLDAVATAFSLTPAEARLLTYLMAGSSAREAADALGVGLGTVRTHLHRIFDKTGTRRQAELIKLVSSLAVPLTVG